MPEFGSAVVECTVDGVVLGAGGMSWSEAVSLAEWIAANKPAGSDQWCPVCHTYHQTPGEKTDRGALIRPCPLLPIDDPANQFSSYPATTRVEKLLQDQAMHAMGLT